MRRPSAVPRLLAATAVALAGLLAPAAALADTGTIVVDCAPPPPMEKAIDASSIVFVGQVTATANDGRSATVSVSEVWRGEVPTPVTVNGGSDPTNPAEDDRTFQVGVTYLFMPAGLDSSGSGQLVDSICSGTTVWTDDLARLRPSDVQAPVAASPSSPGPLAFLGPLVGPVAMAGLIGGGAFVFALLVARRRDA